jgi:hypothetical protein
MLMRAMQGLALGGEYGGAATHIAEHTPDGRRGLYTSWVHLRLSARHRIRVARLLSLRDAATALPRSDEALKIKF